MIRRHGFYVCLAASLVISACATSGAGPRSADNLGGTRAAACKSNDQPVASASACLSTQDSACYQLSNGSWCTGERGNTCPAGSNPIPAGTSCPRGTRCFEVSDSLTCTISY